MRSTARAWEFNRNDAFTALNGFQPRVPDAKPPRLNRNQFGANIGGPVLIPEDLQRQGQDVFLLQLGVGTPGVRDRSGARRWCRPPRYRTGNFSGSDAAIFDPHDGLPFPGNMIPASRIAPLRPQVPRRFVPAAETNEAGINYRGPRAAAPINQDQYVARIDHPFSSTRYAFRQLHVQHPGRQYGARFRFDTRGNRARGAEPEPFRSARFHAGHGERGPRRMAPLLRARILRHDRTSPSSISANMIGIAGSFQGSAQLRLADFQRRRLRFAEHARHRTARPPESALAGALTTSRFAKGIPLLKAGAWWPGATGPSTNRLIRAGRSVSMAQSPRRRRELPRETSSSPHFCWGSPRRPR